MSRGRRLLSFFVASTVILTGIGIGATTALGRLLPDPVANPAVVIHRTDTAAFTGLSDAPFFVLVIGNDERPGVDGRRSDGLHLVGINPAQRQATIINIPRDTYVPIPGHGRAKINDANTFGGPPLAAETVGLLMGVPVSWAVQVNFAGFISVVDAIGGVDVFVPQQMRDPASGANFPRPGVYHMDGALALAFCRDRHDVAGGDFRRTYHQTLVLLAALAKIRSGDTSPGSIANLTATFLKFGELHSAKPGELLRMARLVVEIDPGTIRNVTLPSASVNIRGISAASPTAAAKGLMADFADDAILQTFQGDGL